MHDAEHCPQNHSHIVITPAVTSSAARRTISTPSRGVLIVAQADSRLSVKPISAEPEDMDHRWYGAMQPAVSLHVAVAKCTTLFLAGIDMPRY